MKYVPETEQGYVCERCTDRDVPATWVAVECPDGDIDEWLCDKCHDLVTAKRAGRDREPSPNANSDKYLSYYRDLAILAGSVQTLHHNSKYLKLDTDDANVRLYNLFHDSRRLLEKKLYEAE